MASRPLNHCNHCGYTWHPRGHNVSSACPRCRSSNVGVVAAAPWPSLADVDPTVVKGCAGCVCVILVMAMFGAIIESCNGKKPGDTTTEPTKLPLKQPVPELSPRNPPVVKATKARKDEPIQADTPGVTEPTPSGDPTPVPIPKQPEPKLSPKLPPPRWSSEWANLGNIEARVKSAAIEDIQLVSAKGTLAGKPKVGLLVTVETRAVKGQATTFPWHTFKSNYATLTGTDGYFVHPLRLNLELLPIGEDGKARPVGSTPVAEVLAFEAPKASEELTLTLDGARVGENGRFEIRIPAKAWDKP